jgi:hypothetical protein
LEQCRQRVYQIALGFEDCNDSDTLPHDPLLKTVGDRPPSDEHGLSSLPTLSRFENSVDWMTIRRLIRAFEETYVASLPDDTTEFILDIDATDDEIHGAQQAASSTDTTITVRGHLALWPSTRADQHGVLRSRSV